MYNIMHEKTLNSIFEYSEIVNQQQKISDDIFKNVSFHKNIITEQNLLT